MAEDGRETAALTALYQAERTDNSGIMNTSLALIGAGTAYLAGTLALWEKFSVFGGWIALLPLPLWCVTAFHSLLLASSVVKAQSIILLEEDLKSLVHSGNMQRNARLVGYVATEQVMNLKRAWRIKAHRPFAVSTIITYGGVGLIIVIYTIAVVIKSGAYIGAWAIAPGVAYLLLTAAVAAAWIAALSKVEKASDSGS